jgi:hypothetical protein
MDCPKGTTEVYSICESGRVHTVSRRRSVAGITSWKNQKDSLLLRGDLDPLDLYVER